MAEKSYRPWAPTDPYLLPPSPKEWLSKEHLVYFVLEVVEALDLSAVEAEIQRKDPRGERPYSPQMMTALLVYGYCKGIYSSRRLERQTYEEVAFRLIVGQGHPHFTTINEFRLQHGQALAGLFVQVLELCRRAGLVKLGQVALDGTKIKAAASKHKAMSYHRMNEEEGRLRKLVEEMLEQADRIDEEEDRLYGVGKSVQDLPPELCDRKERLKRIHEAKAALEQEAAEARAAQLREHAAEQRKKEDDQTVDSVERKRASRRAEKSERQAERLSAKRKASGEGEDPSQQELPLHQVAVTPEGLPAAKAQRNFTDPESQIMVKGGAFVQAYNAQVVVDAAYQVIIAEGVSNQAPDTEYLVPMVERTVQLARQVPEVLLADSGYFSAKNAAYLRDKSIDGYLAVGRDKRADQPKAEVHGAKAEMAKKLSTPAGKANYARRKAIVEPVFGQIEEARGFRRFSQRSQAKVQREWTIVCTIHNLLKLFHYGRPKAPPMSLNQAFVVG